MVANRFVLLMLAASVWAAACDKVPLVAPSGTVITLIATSNSVPANGSGEIIAVLIENGTTSTGAAAGGAAATTVAGAGTTVHNGTLVTFATTLGRIDPQEARTTNGRATVRLIADGRSGVATVTALSGGASKTLTINVGAAAAARVLVSATPQALPPAGGTTTITARVEDAQGNGIAAVPVTFTATVGNPAQSPVVTDDAGVARTTLTTTAASTVTASLSGGTGTAGLTGTVAVTVSPSLSLDIAAPATGVTVGVPAALTVTIGTQVVVSNVVVDFGDGESVSLGGASGARTVSHVYASTGSVTATATATTKDGTQFSSTPVFVADYAPTISCPSGSSLTVGSALSFTTTFPAGMSVGNFVYQFADEGNVAGGATIFHTFLSAGTKVVTVTVYPTRGPAKTASCSLKIS